MPEEELDDLFRKSASEFHPEYDPTAWQAMEKKLDAYYLTTGFWHRLIWLTALFLIMGLGFWISLLWLHQKEERESLPFPTHTDFSQSDQQPLATDINRRPSTGAPAKIAGIPKPAGIPKSADRVAGPAGLPAGILKKLPEENSRIAGNRTEPVPGNNLLTRPDRLRRNSGELLPLPAPGRKDRPYRERRQMKSAVRPLLAQSRDNQLVRRELVNGPLPPANPANQVRMTGKDTGTDPAVISPALSLPGVDSLSKPAIALPDSSVAPPDHNGTPDKKAGRISSRLALRLLVAPDLSMVGFANPGGISTNAGVELSYRVSPRWRLATGVLKARKVYTAKPEDYGKPDYWKNRTRPDDIDAVCRVLDIPLNIGYQLITREKSAFTLSTGLSSYWMLSEAYDYHYRSGYAYSKTWRVRNQNRHLFSIYNLSGLYTHRLTPAMAWGIEPFIKVPLAGVGAGRVKLASGGVAFSLSYQFR